MEPPNEEDARDSAQSVDRARRVNPRRQTRALSADILTPAGVAMHAVSHDVSAYGASFFITAGAEALEDLRVGDVVTLNTSTARGLRGQINSIRPVGEEDTRPLVGVKLLDGQQWLNDGQLDAALLDLVPAVDEVQPV